LLLVVCSNYDLILHRFGDITSEAVEELLVDDPPSPLKFALKVTHPLLEHHNFDQYRTQCLNRESWRKEFISTNRKSNTRFPKRHKWIVYVTPKSPKALFGRLRGNVHDFAVFASKIQLLSK